MVALYLMNLAAFVNIESNREASADPVSIVRLCGTGLTPTFRIHQIRERVRTHRRHHEIETATYILDRVRERRVVVEQASPIRIEISTRD